MYKSKYLSKSTNFVCCKVFPPKFHFFFKNQRNCSFRATGAAHFNFRTPVSFSAHQERGEHYNVIVQLFPRHHKRGSTPLAREK